MKKNSLLFLVIFLFGVLSVYAQLEPTIQDCLGAIPVCQQIYVQDNSPFGDGNIPNEIQGNCMAGEFSSTWYSFTVEETGDFGFLITPNDLSDDYDWALYDITNASCSDISTDPSLVVSCNAAGGEPCHGATGANGESNLNSQPGGCFAGNSPFNDFVPVIAGNTYVLAVSNWSQSPFGYELDFGISDVGIFDEDAPFVSSYDFPGECGGNEIRVTFNEFIDCASIDADNFEITGPGEPYSLQLSSTGCDLGGNFDKVFIVTATPEINTAGIYNFNIIANGIDEILDLCGNPSSSSSSNFEIENSELEAINLGADATICAGESVTLDATSENALFYQWQDGSSNPTYTITEPGNYMVSIFSACETVTDDINISVIPAIPDFFLGVDLTLCEGQTIVIDATNSDALSYQWQDGSTNPTFTTFEAGNYSVTITTACETMTDDITINAIPLLPSFSIGNDTTLCEGESFSIDVTTADALSYQWQNGSNNPSITISQAGNYSVTVTTECEVISDAINVNVIPSISSFSLGNDATLCEEDSLILDATTIDVNSYQWQDGSNNSAFTVYEAGDYSVTIASACETISDDISIDVISVLDTFYIGNDTTICAGESLTLDATTTGVSSYQWQDGSSNPVYPTAQTGNYAVTITTACEVLSDAIEVIYLDSISIDLGQDTFLCPGERVLLDASSPHASFQWQDNSNDPQLLATEPGNYSVYVYNECERVEEEVFFKTCKTCLFYTPTAFSPNFDGINDDFDFFSNCVILDFRIKIYDRWGTQVFGSDDQTLKWDGTVKGELVENGVYVWFIDVVSLQNGIPREEFLKGDLTVVR